MDRRELAAWWDEAHNETVWWAAWKLAVDGLTAEQASWKPAPGRHSIWDIVNHITYWRGYFVHRARGGEPVTEEEQERLNWQPPEDLSDAAWAVAQQRFSDTHALVRELILDETIPEPPKPQLHPRYLLLHDGYHLGQIMFLRALQGMPALES